MKTKRTAVLMVVAAGMLGSMHIAHGDGMFYRIASTQQTAIVSFDVAGSLEWTNSTVPSICGVERTPRLDLSWEPYLDPVITTGTATHVVLPLSGAVPISQQKFLFEFNHVGGWTFGHGGLYVDSSGFAYTYYQDRPFDDPTNGVFTTSYLEGKTSSNRLYLATVETDELVEMWNLLPLAATGTVSNPRQVANDLGITAYRGFMLNAGSNTYTVVLLGMEGDFEATNSAPEATTLINWIGSLIAKIPEGWFTP